MGKAHKCSNLPPKQSQETAQRQNRDIYDKQHKTKDKTDRDKYIKRENRRKNTKEGKNRTKKVHQAL